MAECDRSGVGPQSRVAMLGIMLSCTYIQKRILKRSFNVSGSGLKLKSINFY